MKTKLMALLLLAGTSVFARTHVAFGFGVGAGPAYGYYAAAPAPGYVWVPGYNYPVGPRYVWRPGYWARPRFYGGRYVPGYWRR